MVTFLRFVIASSRLVEFRRDAWRILLRSGALIVFGLAGLTCVTSLAASAQTQESTAVPESAPQTSTPQSATAPSSTDQQVTGVITGTVTDKSGALAVGAKVILTEEGQAPREILSGDNGDYSFSNVPPGTFHLTVTAPGFDTQKYTGQLKTGQALLVPPIQLSFTAAVT